MHVICLHLSALECLLVEEIHVAAVPDVIIIKHCVFYLLSKTQRESEREEGSTVHLLKKEKKHVGTQTGTRVLKWTCAANERLWRGRRSCVLQETLTVLLHYLLLWHLASY